jgi:glutamine---fructose-6-phosphate transaminase (isomerizing)
MVFRKESKGGLPMANRGEHTLSEIMSQPTVWAETLESFLPQFDSLKELWLKGNFDRVIFSGCGSTYYLSALAASLFQTLTGVPTHAHPASEIVLLPEVVFIPNTNPLFITVSRSGETTETVEAVKVFREITGNPVVTVVCYEESTLAKEADISIVAYTAKEESLAQTRSFSSMTVIVEAIACLIAGQDDYERMLTLPVTAKRLLDDYHDLARHLGEIEDIEKFFFLGSGSLNGIANEAMLKMKEMSLAYSEAFHVLEFRHGPMSMVDDKTLVVGLISENAREQEVAVLRQMRDKGAPVMIVSEDDYGLGLADIGHFVHLKSALPQWARPVAYLPVLQLMAYYRAMSRGQNPDQPANLTAVISLDNLRS